MGDDVPLSALLGLVAFLLVLSAFFSGSETALMSLNRYRLRHRARAGHRGARLAETLLSRPDRLLGLILLGNNLVNITAATLVGIIAFEIGGQLGAAIGSVLLTLVVLVFAETAPKTLAALHPERLAYPAAFVYYPLLKIVFPFVWMTNVASNAVLYLFGVRQGDAEGYALTREELRTVVYEAGVRISSRYRQMLVSILDLEKVTVDDVMVPHNEIAGIDLDEDMDDILDVIRNSGHTRLPVYRDNIDQVIGMLHLRRLAWPADHPAELLLAQRQPLAGPQSLAGDLADAAAEQQAAFADRPPGGAPADLGQGGQSSVEALTVQRLGDGELARLV